MENYAALKARLVERAGRAIIGGDDDWCRDIAERLPLTDRSWVDILSGASVCRRWYAVGSELVARAPWTGPLAHSPTSRAWRPCAGGTTSRMRSLRALAL